MAYNTKKGSQHSGDIQYEGDPNDVQIDFENDQVSLMAGGVQRLTANSASVSISGSLSASANVVATGDVHSANVYTGTLSSSLDIMAKRGVSFANSNFSVNTAGQISSSGGIISAGAAILGSTLDVSGNITTSGITALMDFNCSENANAFRVRGADAEYFRVDTDSNLFYFRNNSKTRFGSHTVAPTHTVTVTGDISGSGLTTLNTISASADVYVTGAVKATTFYGSGAGLTGVGTMSSFSLAGDGGSAQTVENGNTVTIAGGTGLTSTAAATDTVSIALDNTAVTAGSYNSANITVDAQGRLTAASNGALPTFLSGTTAQLTTGVETSGYLKVSGSSTLNAITATTISASSTLLAQGNTVLGGTAAISGNVNIGGPNQANSSLYVKSPSDNSVVSIFKSPSHDTILAMTGSGQVLVGGMLLNAKLNVSGSDPDKLISAAAASRGETFYISGSGEAFISGSVILQDVEPTIYFSGSDGTILGQIGYNSANNIVLQNNFNNQHIVLKASDGGVLKEGLRLDGAVPEVVVNQTSDSLVSFRVESDDNTHMFYVSGSTDQVGVGVSDPAIGVTLDISGSAIRLRDPSTPANASAPGVPGEIRWDSSYIYICVAIDTWKRAAIASW